MKAADAKVIRAVKGMTEAARRAQISEYSRTVPGWGQTWKRVRLRCRECDGYLVYSRRVKLGPYCTNRCGYTMTRSMYLSLKAIAVEDALMGYKFPEDIWPYFRIEAA